MIKRISNNEAAITRTALTLTQVSFSAQEDDLEFERATKVESFGASEEKNSHLVTNNEVIKDRISKSPMLARSTRCNNIYCSDAGYLDYVGLFFQEREVNIYLTQKEDVPNDFLTKLHSYGMGTNKLYKVDLRRARSVDNAIRKDDEHEVSDSVSVNDHHDSVCDE